MFVVLRKGDKVEHPNRPEWGVGILQEDEKVGEVVRIFFEKGGLKKFITKNIGLIKTDREPSTPLDNSSMLLGATYESADGFPTHAFIYCKELDNTSFLLITTSGPRYQLRSLNKRKWESGFKAPSITTLENFCQKYPIYLIDATENATGNGVVKSRSYWQGEIRKLNKKYNISE